MAIIQWIKTEDAAGDVFAPIGPAAIVKKLDAGAYNVQETMQGVQFVRSLPKTDALIQFKGSSMDSILTEVEHFWTLKGNFDKLGFLHNRGVLMHGPPGSGKSCLIQQVVESMTKQGDIVIFSKSIGSLMGGLKALRLIESGRRTVVVLEDIDGYEYSERTLLQLLDGENSVDNVLYLATTNHKHKISERLMRPGRFDKHVFVDFPPEEGRYVFLKTKLEGVEKDETIKHIARSTPNFSFGHLRELVIAAYAFGEKLEAVIKRLKGVPTEKLPSRELSIAAEPILKESQRLQESRGHGSAAAIAGLSSTGMICG
jgi:hypothetical protein